MPSYQVGLLKTFIDTLCMDLRLGTNGKVIVCFQSTMHFSSRRNSSTGFLVICLEEVTG